MIWGLVDQESLLQPYLIFVIYFDIAAIALYVCT